MSRSSLTLEQALAKGHRMLTYPAAIVMVTGFLVVVIAGIRLSAAPVWIFPLGFLLSVIASWLFWSMRVPKWKLWAFSNFRNVHELKKISIRERLIWPDDHILNRTEIWTAPDRARWRMLEPKFLVADEIFIEDDYTVPSQTVIRYGRGKITGEIIIWSLFVLGGFALILCFGMYLIGSLTTGLGAVFAISAYRKLRAATPQIILTSEGIETVNTIFHRWSDVKNEEVEIEGYGEHTNFNLVYDHPTGSERLRINDYEVNRWELGRLLKIYRSKSLKQL